MQGTVPAKEKAELLKLIFSKKNAFSELLATEMPKHKIHPSQGLLQAWNTIPSQTKFDYLQERENY